MASLKLGEIVKVLTGGYPLPPGTEGVVTGFNVSGVEVCSFEFGESKDFGTVHAFALSKVPLPRAEMLWNRLRHKEDMIARAMRVWGAGSVALTYTDVVGEPFKVTVNWRNGTQLLTRAKSVAEAMKNAFLLAYFLRVTREAVQGAHQELLDALSSLREEVRAL